MIRFAVFNAGLCSNVGRQGLLTSFCCFQLLYDIFNISQYFRTKGALSSNHLTHSLEGRPRQIKLFFSFLCLFSSFNSFFLAPPMCSFHALFAVLVLIIATVKSLAIGDTPYDTSSFSSVNDIVSVEWQQAFRLPGNGNNPANGMEAVAVDTTIATAPQPCSGDVGTILQPVTKLRAREGSSTNCNNHDEQGRPAQNERPSIVPNILPSRLWEEGLQLCPNDMRGKPRKVICDSGLPDDRFNGPDGGAVLLECLLCTFFIFIF